MYVYRIGRAGETVSMANGRESSQASKEYDVEILPVGQSYNYDYKYLQL